jgi:hypothetical protein
MVSLLEDAIIGVKQSPVPSDDDDENESVKLEFLSDTRAIPFRFKPQSTVVIKTSLSLDFPVGSYLATSYPDGSTIPAINEVIQKSGFEIWGKSGRTDISKITDMTSIAGTWVSHGSVDSSDVSSIDIFSYSGTLVKRIA